MCAVTKIGRCRIHLIHQRKLIMSMSRRVTLSALVCMSLALAAGSANARDYPKEIESDLQVAPPNNGNLERWASQGVLLLNATLTVRAGQAGSHQGKGWEQFTDRVIELISQHKENVVFLLWGGFAKKKASKVDGTKHHILTSGHPSPLSANRGYWFGNRHFSKTNALIEKSNQKPITW